MRRAVPLTRFLSLLAAAVVVAAFFLPWMEGASELRFRTFSGFDFARLIRNFEITAGSQYEAGQIRATAVFIYLMPALVVNAAVLRLIEFPLGISRRVTGAAAALAGSYGLAVLGSLLLLSVVQLNDFADVVGAPRYGIPVSAIGCAVLLALGLPKLWRARSSRT